MSSRFQRAIDHFNIREYIEELFEDVQYAANGEELRINCFAPNGCARGDNKHKLYVNPSKKQWLCFKCGYGTSQQPGTGSIVRFIADAENIPPILVRHRLSKLSYPTPQEELEDLLQNLFDPVVLPSNPTNKTISLDKGFYPLTTKVGLKGKSALRYAESRGLTEGELIRYDVRYRPVGISSTIGDKQWSGRLVFPIYDRQGILRSASGRLVTDNIAQQPERPRWWHWPNTDIDRLLWPLNPNALFKTFDSHIILTEGIFDALAVNQLSDQQALCTFGHKISIGQIQLLQNLEINSVTVAWDYDSKQAMANAVKNLEMYGIEAKVIPFIEKDYWINWDLGAMISTGMNWSIDQMQEILLNELKCPISVHEPEFVRWMVA